MILALAEARKFVGATAPNPPVGAVVLDAEGTLLAVAAHARAGEAHAEAKALALCERNGTLARADTVVVTLEPCNHRGRTPPCTEALIRARVRRVVFGARDPNPVATGGADALRDAGIEVVENVLDAECAELLLPFRTRVLTGLPWIVVKTALTRSGSMIPEPGQKTFTSDESLRLAHELRRRADAIVTGSGTILADDPAFTVRHVEDHAGKRRPLAILDRRRRVPAEWLERARARGLDPFLSDGPEDAFRVLAAKGCLEVLVEAGPALSQEILSRGLWHRQVEICQGPPGEADRTAILTNDNPPGLR